jgi:hypothetical protein
MVLCDSTTELSENADNVNTSPVETVNDATGEISATPISRVASNK